ncbi:MAG: hypothetical protein JWL69_3961 [Phycisphaerales bacterium]|nr:hypothetical protein [Phycisphaerales bacterium]MDB5357348.1 hypothetical protein [Phycisphaerales bacterium]
MMVESLESRQLLSTTYTFGPITVSNNTLTATGSGSITVGTGTVTLTGSVSGTFKGTPFTFSGTETFTK